MNQRLLERLKRHSEFPQLRPGVTVLGQRGSIEPFSAGQPRLALPKQSAANARAFDNPQPLEPALSTDFTEPVFSQATQTAPVETLADADLNAALDAAQADRAALEDFAVDDRSNFSESPFLLEAQSVATTNTEATITAPLNAALSAVNLAASTNLSANSSANQLEPALAVRNPQRNAEPRIAELGATAQPVSPTTRIATTPPVAATTPNALETPTGVVSVSNSLVSINAETSADARAADPAAAQMGAPSESLAPKETAGLAVDDASLSVSPANALSNALSNASSNAPRAESSANAEAVPPPAESAPDFDRKAAMLELRELGVKVRVTLSNAGLKAQLEAVRATAPSAATRPAAVGALEAARDTSATSALEARSESGATATIDRSDVQIQSNSSNAGFSRIPDATSSALEPIETNSAEREELEPARPESLAAPSAVAASALEPVTTLGTQRPSAERSTPLEVNSTLIAGSGAEPTVDGTVVAFEVYNPPNRRATITRPKATEAPKTEAEVLFSTLPDSSPLEWLSLLNSAQALDADVSKAVDLAAQVRPSPAQGSPASESTPEDPAPTGATPINAVRTGAPLLPNLEVSGNLSRPRLERPTALVAPLGAPEQGSQPSAAQVSGTARSAPTVQPTPTTTQRQAASQTSDRESASATTSRAAALGDAAPERTARQSAALERSELSNGLEADGLEANDLEVMTVETAAAQSNIASDFSPLEEDAMVMESGSQSMPRTVTEGASDDRASGITREPRSEPRDPATSSSPVTSSAVPSNDQPSSLGERGADATRPASDTASVTGASVTSALLSAPAATDQQSNLALQSDSAAQGTVVAFEVYNPPNRRATITRPKATEAPKTEAEVLFSTLSDSSPLEWLSLLNNAQAFDADSSSAPAVARRGASSGALNAGDAPQAAPLAARSPGSPVAPDLGAARVAQNTARNTIQNTAQTDPRLSLRATANPAQTLETPTRGSLLESEPSSTQYGAQPLAPNAQIGSAQTSAPLIATPPSAGLLIAALPTNPESPARAAAQPVRLSSSAQRLIAPITGIDPATVQIRRDADSDALTKAYRADALTVNGTVLLSARLGAETPETLGVIAHELTHVARERQPRFVPPALRQPLIPGSASSRSASLEGQGEESIALQVEGFTRALAQQGMTLNNTPLSNSRSVNGVAPGRSRSLESVPWGDGVLPAPWELADRLEALANPGLAAARRQSAQPTAFQPSAFQPSASQQSAAPQSAFSSAVTRSDAPTFAGSSSNSSQPAAFSSGGSFGGIGGANTPISVQAADQGRSVPTPSPEGPLPKSPEAAPKPASAAAPAPDLDDLARQVYAVLKRRLITERRRSS